MSTTNFSMEVDTEDNQKGDRVILIIMVSFYLISHGVLI